MTNEKEKEGKEGIEWSIRVEGAGASEILKPTESCKSRVMTRLKGLVLKMWGFLKKAWELGVDDPRKVIHCIKVGIALTVVSLFYYMRPLYDGVGGNAIWAIMTVVVVFEFTVGGTLYKCLNRICATTLAGSLALGIHWVASQSGERFEPIIMGVAVFILASATTFSRFIPQVKARFDYGCTIFILTFSLVSVSGYRVEKLLDLAHSRVSTIVIGTCLCITIGMLICPVWAGMELHLLLPRNMDKLADSLNSCALIYFGEGDEESEKKLQEYKCVLNSKASEESMANFARWEPAHGQFNFRHPWKKYLKVGASMRSCAYCIETLTSCLDSKDQVPEAIKNHIAPTCLRLSSNSSNVMRELATSITTMKKSSQMIDSAVEEMKNAVLELQNDLKSLPGLLVPPQERDKKELVVPRATTATPLMDVIPLVSFASLSIEIAARIEGIAEAVKDLANAAQFQVPDTSDDKVTRQVQSNSKVAPNEENKDEEKEMTTLDQRV